MEVSVVTADANAGAEVRDLYPSLAAAYDGVVYEDADPGRLAGLDLVFAALPHGASQRVMPALLDVVDHVVDLGADFRLPPALYREWYGEEHAAPELVGRFAYGLPELYRAEIATARHVAAPGCYPTTASLALAPLVEAGLIEPRGIVVDAASGVSGAGRSLRASSLFSEVDQSFAAYGLLDHRHTPEMELALAHAAGRPVQVLFTPHLAPMVRGILATCYARPAVDDLRTDDLLDLFRARYADEPFVLVGAAPPVTKATLGANAAHVSVRYDPRTATVVALGALDNLVKGASGQAIQCANVLLGLPETTGLSAIGLMP
jgi:N-acetyl-gamma-glutamyl-phosphate reductase